MEIHPTAVIHPKACVDPSVIVGPYCTIDSGVTVGAGCVLGPYVHLTGQTEVGAENRFHAGCVIGDAPQDLRYQGELTRVVIGRGNCFREHVTVHRSHCLEEATVIGDENFFMAQSHIGHNSRVGHRNIFANGVLVAGHVVIEDQVFLSGYAMVHQFVRIGRLAMMQGGAGVSKDLPPFMMASGNNHLCGLNTVGLRRAGMGIEERTELKRLYHHLFMGSLRLTEALIQAEELFSAPASRDVLAFARASERGLCSHRRR